MSEKCLYLDGTLSWRSCQTISKLYVAIAGATTCPTLTSVTAAQFPLSSTISLQSLLKFMSFELVDAI